MGLLGAMADLDSKTILEGNDIFEEFKGSLTEQYVLCQLKRMYRIKCVLLVIRKRNCRN